MTKINNIAVLGAGVMGSQIASHFVNAGYKVKVFDISQEICEKGLEFCKNLKPAPLYNPKSIENIIPLNYDEHIGQLKDCDWIIEVIAERLDWKEDLYKKIIPNLKDTAFVTSNTSGLLVKELLNNLPEDFRKRFFVTHFFNPPRYMKLVEIISGEDTDSIHIENAASVLDGVASGHR